MALQTSMLLATCMLGWYYNETRTAINNNTSLLHTYSSFPNPVHKNNYILSQQKSVLTLYIIPHFCSGTSQPLVLPDEDYLMFHQGSSAASPTQTVWRWSLSANLTVCCQQSVATDDTFGRNKLNITSSSNHHLVSAVGRAPDCR